MHLTTFGYTNDAKARDKIMSDPVLEFLDAAAPGVLGLAVLPGLGLLALLVFVGEWFGLWGGPIGLRSAFAPSGLRRVWPRLCR